MTAVSRHLSQSLSNSVHHASRAMHPDGEKLSALINLAGRQRMLSQRLVLNAVLAAQDDAQALNTLRETLSTMRESHQRLAHGGDEWPGAYSESLKQVYFGAQQADARIKGFLGLAQQVLDGLSRRQHGITDVLQNLVAEANPILQLLNELTQAHEAEASHRTKQDRARHRDLMDRLQLVAREAKVVAFNAQVAAFRAGQQGPEFGVVAARMGAITEEMERLVDQAR
ncbi:MAG: type IV pili methyl-accepting chemotaxis transducer N-terminal domain-containing protein [Aquabacterium sp.]